MRHRGQLIRTQSELTTRRGWLVAGTALLFAIALAGCGRVDLEDLTPEAFKTQEAQNAANAAATTAGGGDRATPSGFEDADIAGGEIQYNTWCTGCHDSARAPSIKGKVFNFADISETMRTGTGFSQPHPKYTPFELPDENFVDILAYLASLPPQ